MNLATLRPARSDEAAEHGFLVSLKMSWRLMVLCLDSTPKQASN